MSTEVFERAVASTEKVLANLDKSQLGQPTPCASWTVKDLLNHLVNAPFWFAAVVEHGDRPEGFETPDRTAGDIQGAFAEGTQKAIAAFGAPGAQEKVVKLPWGEMPAGMFMNIAAQDIFVHGWDLARAIRCQADLDDQLAEQFLPGARMLPDAFRGPEGAPFGHVVDVPDSAPASDRLAGALGRQV